MRRMLSGFFRLNLLLGAAIAVAGGVVAIRFSWVAALIVGVAFAAVAKWLFGWRVTLAALILTALGAGNGWRQERDRMQATEALGRLSSPMLSGTLMGDARTTPSGWSGLVKLHADPSAGVPSSRVWWAGDGVRPVDGAMVAARGRLSGPRAPRNPGEFDQQAWFEREGIAALFVAERGRGTVTTSWWPAFTAKVRQTFREAVATGLPSKSEEAATIRAVVLGDYPRDREELVSAYRDSGTLHVFSVSGMHVAMVGVIGWWVLSRIGVSRRWAVPVLITLMFAYSWVSGNSPPAVRAAWMGAVFLGAFFFRREPNLLNSLGAVLLVTLLWEPRLLLQPGVQLSYGIVAVIALWGKKVSHPVARLFEHDEYLPKSLLTSRQRLWTHTGQKLANVIGVAFVAWVGSLPLTLWHFGMTAPVAILAAVPMSIGIFCLMCLSLLAAVLFPLVPPAAVAVNQLNEKVAFTCNAMARGMTQVPYGHTYRSSVKKPFLVIFDLEHQAGAAAFVSDTGTVLLDCGDKRAFRYTIVSALKSFSAIPDSLVLSHADGGHVGGGEELMASGGISQALLPVATSRSPLYRTWQKEAAAQGVKTLMAHSGMNLPFPEGASLEVVWAPSPEISRAADEQVAIYRLHWQGWRFLFVSDAGLRIENALLAAGADIRADVLIAGVHEGGLSLTDDFVARVAPKTIVPATTSHPAPSEAYRNHAWRKSGIEVIDQRNVGGITFHITPSGTLEVKGYANGFHHEIKR